MATYNAIVMTHQHFNMADTNPFSLHITLKCAKTQDVVKAPSHSVQVKLQLGNEAFYSKPCIWINCPEFNEDAIFMLGSQPAESSSQENTFLNKLLEVSVDGVGSGSVDIASLSLNNQREVVVPLEYENNVVESTSNQDFPRPCVILCLVLKQHQLRPEIKTIIKTTNVVSNAADSILGPFLQSTSNVTAVVKRNSKVIVALTIMAVPSLGLLILVASPIWLPVILFGSVVGFPIWVPLLLCGILLGSCFVGIASLLFLLSSKHGSRKSINSVSSKFIETRVGAQIAYNTGPIAQVLREDISRKIVPKTLINKLILSLMVDFFGNCSFALPGLGEAADILWAPVSAFLLDQMYGKSSPAVKYFGFLEEVLPFTDILPTATLAWAKEFAPLIAFDLCIRLGIDPEQAAKTIPGLLRPHRD